MLKYMVQCHTINSDILAIASEIILETKALWTMLNIRRYSLTQGMEMRLWRSCLRPQQVRPVLKRRHERP